MSDSILKSPFLALSENERFMKATNHICWGTELMEHYFNCRSTKDTLIFLTAGSLFILFFEWLIVFGPLALFMFSLYNNCSFAKAPVPNDDRSQAMRFTAKLMRQMSDQVEFLYLFLDEYVYWGHQDKSRVFRWTMGELTICGIFATLTIGVRYVFLSCFWLLVLTRLRFTYLIITTAEGMLRETVCRLPLLHRWGYVPSFPIFLSFLKREKNKFA